MTDGEKMLKQIGEYCKMTKIFESNGRHRDEAELVVDLIVSEHDQDAFDDLYRDERAIHAALMFFYPRDVREEVGPALKLYHENPDKAGGFGAVLMTKLMTRQLETLAVLRDELTQ